MLHLKGEKTIVKIAYRVALSVIFTFYMMTVILFGVTAYLRYTHPLKYTEEVFDSCDKYGVNPLLVLSIIKVESSFNPDAISSKNAVGLMQVKPQTAEYLYSFTGIDYDLFIPKDNIDAGTYYIRYLIDKFKNQETALIAYNAGEGNVSNWLNNEKYSKDGKTLDSVPFKETEKYIVKIKKSFINYKNLYGNIVDKF